ncbi:testis specific protein Y-linked [Pangasianodon hypophthalmus]|uniref:testis specific protein Y-linked n=1 Tax=Pangasianodon hypophthalmus TaxID=310915 RepID=UPI002306EDA8|nr:testis specific protein Y-linked [Pangasianodon hypophthalmus]
MNTASDSSNKPSECNRKRSASPRQQEDSPLSKQLKVDEEEAAESDSRERAENDALPLKHKNGACESSNAPELSENRVQNANGTENASGTERKDGDGESSEGQKARSDCATIDAAEALASLTGAGDQRAETPCSSKQALGENTVSKQSRAELELSTRAEDSCSVSALRGVGGEARVRARRADEEEEEEEEEDDSLPGSSLTASSSDDDDDDDDDDQEREECAIVSVQMAPELRRSVALLAHVQMRLDALEKKGARLHRRLELRLGRQRRPHLEQRAAIAQSIPGFWLTALLNHPHLSAQIDENDEDALSYMINLEIETFKNNKLGYRICFHFRRNPFFQNKVIVKELHLGLGGSPVSFSNPIVWHHGQSLTRNGEPRRNSRGVYESFFHWFDDHSSPGMDEIAQILKDDLYKDPLRYYLTPLWEPRENGSTSKPPQNSNGDECVIISDSDDDQELVSHDRQQEQEDQDDEDNEDEGRVTGAGDSDQEGVESSSEERQEEEVDIEEVDEVCHSASSEVRELGQEEEEGDIEVNEDEEEEEN